MLIPVLIGVLILPNLEVRWDAHLRIVIFSESQNRKYVPDLVVMSCDFYCDYWSSAFLQKHHEKHCM